MRAFRCCFTIILLLAGAATATAQPQTAALAFEDEGLDLETGEVVDLTDLMGVDDTADFHVAYNADRTVHAAIFQIFGAEIAHLAETPFEYVSASDIAAVEFTSGWVDEPCGSGDSVLLRTATGSVYKIGNLLEDPAVGVVFDYELLESPQAALPLAGEADVLLASASTPADLEPPEGLSAEAWKAISEAVERGRYGAHAEADAGVLEASNPAQRYAARFTAQGLTVSPLAGGAELTLTLAAVGFGNALEPVAAARPVAEGQRVEYARGQITEWYVNRPSGLEQGWTLASPPGENPGDEPLRLALAVGGGLTPMAAAGGSVVEFLDAAGTTRLSYAGLAAWDATGRDLPARLEAANGRIGITVDETGAIYPLTIDPTIVNEDAKLLPSDGAVNDWFGDHVAVSGSTVVVTALYDDDNGSNSGSAYVFEEPAGGWSGTLSESAKLLASDGAPNDTLGEDVSVSGSTIVVGGRGDDDNGSDSGSAYVFEKPAGGWSGTVNESAKLLASDGAAGDGFGVAVFIQGSTVVVGAFGDDDFGRSSGSAYVFEEPAGGWSGTVNESAKLLASNGAAGDLFGVNVSISDSTVVVGAAYKTGGGMAFVFEEPVGGWSGNVNESARLQASDAGQADQFGRAVSASGSTVIVGANSNDDDGSNSGSVYVFEEPAGGWSGTLYEAAKLLASDAAAGDRLGYSVSVSGSTVVAGGEYNDDYGSNSGSAYLFEEPAGGWSGTLNETDKLLASDGAAENRFGEIISFSGSAVVVGARLDGDNGWRSGSAYVFSFAVCIDSDGDGWGDPGDTSCPNGTQTDCDDTTDQIFPGATEDCNGVDDNCDGFIDEGFDLDGDGWTTCAGDCDDGDADINPDATEVCNGVDDNCDGDTDEGTPDGDGDTVCDAIDNCPFDANPGQENCDGDDFGDVCDTDDTDEDGLTDAQEISYAGGVCPGGCPDPVDPDTDDDGLLDGFESDADPGKNCSFCSADTDEDGVGDATDPFCNDPTLTGDCPRDLAAFAAYILGLPTEVFQSPGNNNSNQNPTQQDLQTQRHLASIVSKAAKHLDKGKTALAINELDKALARVDGIEPPADDMDAGTPEKASVLETIEDFLYLFEIGVCGG